MTTEGQLTFKRVEITDPKTVQEITKHIEAKQKNHQAHLKFTTASTALNKFKGQQNVSEPTDLIVGEVYFLRLTPGTVTIQERVETEQTRISMKIMRQDG